MQFRKAGTVLPLAVVELGQSALRGLAILLGNVDAGLIHGAHHHVKADVSGAGEERGQIERVKRPLGSDGVSFDARHLHKTADGVAGQA